MMIPLPFTWFSSCSYFRPDSSLFLILPPLLAHDSIILLLHLPSCLAQPVGKGDPVNSIVLCLDLRYE